jgi:hypothetical protein
MGVRMKIEVIHEHSVAVDLLTGGVCIDVGCRGFKFSEAMRDKRCKVVGFDIEDMEPPEGIDFCKYAVLTEFKQVYYIDTKDQQAKFISTHGKEVQAIDIKTIYRELLEDAACIDILKLDCEGSEYIILSDPDFVAAPRQITVEFHMHAHRALHDQYYKKCMDNLLKYYVPVKHELTQAHGAGWNWWDSLFIRKDLI